MVSLKGWLGSTGGPKLPRLTEAQKKLVLETVHTVFHHVEDPSVDILRHGILDWIDYVFAMYPADSSCYTCDYNMSGACAANEYKEIPASFRPLGCDAWKDQGAPF